MGDDNILHEEEVEAAVEDHLEEAGQVGENNAAIDDLVVIAGGESPTQTEHNLVVTAVNDILAVLRNNGIIDESEA